MTTTTDADPLLDVISGMTGTAMERLTDDKSLFHDIGVAGSDGADLLHEIGTRFAIDMAHVDPDRYFGEESPYSVIYHLWCVLRGKRLDDGIIRLQISDLRRTVVERRWCEPTG